MNFFFKRLSRVKCNYLCSYLQVQLGEADRTVTLFFLFSHVCASGSSAPLGTLPSPSIGFNLTNFLGTRPMGFHWSGWFFMCQTDGIPLICSLKFQNALHLSTLCMNWTELHFWALGHLSYGFQEEKLFKKLFFSTWKLTLFGESPMYGLTDSLIYHRLHTKPDRQSRSLDWLPRKSDGLSVYSPQRMTRPKPCKKYGRVRSSKISLLEIRGLSQK